MSSVLIISPEDWDDHWVSKHHYAVSLAARGLRVFFLNPPDDALSGTEIKAAKGYPGIRLVSGPRLVPGLRFWPAVIRRWVEERWLARLEELAGEPIDLIWLFENSRFFDMRFAGQRFKVYHQVDLNQDFNTELAAKTADICFGTTDFIVEKLRPLNDRVYKVHHGLAGRAGRVSLDDVQLNRFSPDTPHAVYVGNLEIPYLDEQLLSKLPASFGNVQFHFVGGYDRQSRLWRSTSGLSNITWWGKVESPLIPAILDRADVLLITYRAAEYPEQVASPHKVLEYLASGKTTVATFTAEYEDKERLLEMADSPEEFLLKFGEVVDHLDYFNSRESCSRRIEFAQAHSYDAQLDRIVEHIEFDYPGRGLFPAGDKTD